MLQRYKDAELHSGEWKQYVIDPDGEGGLPPFNVTCDMNDKNGVGVTVISHDSENRTLVDGSSVINGGTSTAGES